jgi:hypothetical protein
MYTRYSANARPYAIPKSKDHGDNHQQIATHYSSIVPASIRPTSVCRAFTNDSSGGMPMYASPDNDLQQASTVEKRLV